MDRNLEIMKEKIKHVVCMHAREDVSVVWCMTSIVGFTSISIIVSNTVFSIWSRYIISISYTHLTLHLLPGRLHSSVGTSSHRYRGVMASNSVEASEFFLGFLCNCFSFVITTWISFSSILYPQCIHIIDIIYTSQCYSFQEYRENLIGEISLLSKSPSVWKFYVLCFMFKSLVTTE